MKRSTNTRMNHNIAIIGGGNLGTAIAEGLIASKFSKPSEIIITKRNLAALKPLEKKEPSSLPLTAMR